MINETSQFFQKGDTTTCWIKCAATGTETWDPPNTPSLQ